MRALVAIAVASVVVSTVAWAQDTDPATEALAPFERLIGGAWYLDDGYQVFEWGVGRRAVISKSYTLANGQATLVSEGMWMWHPGEKAIKGYFTAVNMPSSSTTPPDLKVP